jgi:U3 small nucleolar RNA-associated protein MPP10
MHVTRCLQGLGEIYEAEYVQQATGFTAPDKQEPLRRQAAALFKELCGKLDALSSFAFAPKPVVEELEVGFGVVTLFECSVGGFGLIVCRVAAVRSNVSS